MALFPLFFNIDHQKILIIGGGPTAYAKAQRLSSWTCDLQAVAIDPIDPLRHLEHCTLIERAWRTEDLSDAFLVIAATGDPDTDLAISRMCRSRRILCNAVDQPAISSAVFGAVIHQKELSIGISTSGASPSAARWMKQRIEEQIPDRFDEILEWLHQKRPEILHSVLEEKKRARLFHTLFDSCMKQNAPLDQETFQRLLDETEHD